jgi:2-methylcitrate dehydratase
VFGTGLCTTATNATLANVFLVHYLGYNDLGGGGHNSDTISAILAVAEREKANGRDFLTSMIMSYELGARFSDSAGGFTAYEAKGFPFDIRGGVTLPPCLGKLMGLNEMQIANAIGICASHSLPLGILDTNCEEHFHAKNLRMGFVARDAIESCILAKYGFTGPIRVIEGDHGFREVLMKGQMDLEKMVDWSGWRIKDVKFKNLCLNSTTMGQVQATLKIVIANDLYPEDIVSVKIGTGYRDFKYTTSLTKKFPRNGETVDHSAF